MRNSRKMFLKLAALLVAALAFIGCGASEAEAQTRASLAVTVTPEGRFAPAVLMPVFTLDKAFGFRAKSSIVAFAGSTVSGGAITGGGAWGFEVPFASGPNANLSLFLGPSLTFEQGVPTRLGFVIGVSF